LRAAAQRLIYPVMSADKPSEGRSSVPRVSRWNPQRPAPARSNRTLFRLIGIPALAVAGVLIYRGVQERLTLPECDSSRAKSTLSNVLAELKVEPLRDEPIKTISSSKEKVECNVALPLSDGGTLNVDYSFFWQGSTAQMRYSISRQPAQTTPTQKPPPAQSAPVEAPRSE
jgi:hypothetical protein